MLTLLCSLIIGIGVYCAFLPGGFAAEHPTWTIVAAVCAFLATQIVISLILRKVTGRIQLQLQAIMQETQKRIQAKQNQFMRRPLSQDAMLRELEKEQFAGIDRMIEGLKAFDGVCLWNLLLRKQVNTMKMMFLYQERKFDEVDALLPKCMLIDAQSVSMKLARMYVREEDDKKIDKFYKSKSRRFKGDELVLVVSTYAWIMVKRDRIDAASKALADAKAVRAKDNPILIKNWEMLVNGKPKHFSNSQIGDVWYALQLEKPKMPKMQQQRFAYR